MFCQGETDWKVIAIDVTDPLAENLNDIHDVEKLMPGFLKVTHLHECIPNQSIKSFYATLM